MRLEGERYYITFVDDFSRYYKVYLPRSKDDEAEQAFISFWNMFSL